MTRIPDHAAPTLLETNGRYFALAVVTGGPLPSDILRSSLRARKLLPTVGALSVERVIAEAFSELRSTNLVAVFPCTRSRQPVYISPSNRCLSTQLPPIIAEVGETTTIFRLTPNRHSSDAACARAQGLLQNLEGEIDRGLRIRLPRLKTYTIAQQREAVRDASNHWMSTFALISMAAAKAAVA